MIGPKGRRRAAAGGGEPLRRRRVRAARRDRGATRGRRAPTTPRQPFRPAMTSGPNISWARCVHDAPRTPTAVHSAIVPACAILPLAGLIHPPAKGVVAERKWNSVHESPDVALGGGGLVDGEGWFCAGRLCPVADGSAAAAAVWLHVRRLGDDDHYVVRFSRRSLAHCEPSNVSLFRRGPGHGRIETDLEGHSSPDLIYVGGGSVVSNARRMACPGLGRRGCGKAGARNRPVRTLGRILCWFARLMANFNGSARVRGPVVLTKLRPLRTPSRAPRGE